MGVMGRRRTRREGKRAEVVRCMVEGMDWWRGFGDEAFLLFFFCFGRNRECLL